MNGELMNHAYAFSWMLRVLFAIAIVSGCDDGLDLGRVSGTVTLDGDPVPNAYVVFTPRAGGRPSQTKTDAESHFTLQFNASNEGALVGEHKVTVSTADITDDGRNIPELIPAKYNVMGAIDVSVVSGANDIRLDLVSTP